MAVDLKKLAGECYALVHPLKLDGPYLVDALVAVQFADVFGEVEDFGNITGPIRRAVEDGCARRRPWNCEWSNNGLSVCITFFEDKPFKVGKFDWIGDNRLETAMRALLFVFNYQAEVSDE